MNIKQLKEYIKDIPDEYEVNFSRVFVLDEKEELTAVLDVPIVGVTKSEEAEHVRFVITMTQKELISLKR